MRLMGAGQVLKRAITELAALPPDAGERLLALPILLRLRFELPADPAEQTQDDREFAMSTQDIVEVWKQRVTAEARQEGRQEGREQGLVEAVLTLYEARFGATPPEIEAAVRQTHDDERLRSLLRLIGTRDAGEVAAAVRDETRR